jgi:hypothetical protein
MKKARKKKTSKKKNTPKKGINIKNAPPEHYFVFMDGSTVKNLKELADALEFITDEVFCHHVSQDKNDFCTWIADIFGEPELAEEVKKAEDKRHIQTIIYRFIIESSEKQK